MSKRKSTTVENELCKELGLDKEQLKAAKRALGLKMLPTNLSEAEAEEFGLQVREWMRLNSALKAHQWNLPAVFSPQASSPHALQEVLRAAFSEHPHRRVMQLLHGISGAGKSYIARELLRQITKESTYTIAWWLRSCQRERLLSDMASLAGLLLPDPPDSEAARIGPLLELLGDRRDWILIFDGAEGPEQLLPFLPQSDGGHILITSPNPFWPLPEQHTHAVGPWSREGAEQLFPSLAHDQHLLAKAWGGLPLAQAHTAQLLQGFEKRPPCWPLPQRAPSTTAEQGSESLTYPSLWREQFERLSAKGQEFIAQCAILAPAAAIPWSIFAEQDEDGWPAAQLELASLSWIRPQDAACFAVEPLLQWSLRALPKAQKAMPKCLTGLSKALAAASTQTASLLLEHAMWLLLQKPDKSEQSIGLLELSRQKAEEFELFGVLTPLAHRALHMSRSEGFARQPDLAAALNNLALSLHRLHANNPDETTHTLALLCIEKCLEIARASLAQHVYLPLYYYTSGTLYEWSDPRRACAHYAQARAGLASEDPAQFQRHVDYIDHYLADHPFSE